MESIWTPELVARLKVLWSLGLSTGEVGKKLGISKNAVQGKADRLMLAKRGMRITRSFTVSRAAAQQIMDRQRKAI